MSLHAGSQGGLAAARRGECDLAGMHLLHSDPGIYNRGPVSDEFELIEGYRRMQVVPFRPDDVRMCRCATAADAVALADPESVMINRNVGSGTRIPIDGLLGEARPEGYAIQPESHDTVVSAVAKERADWGVAIDTVARVRARLNGDVQGALRRRRAALTPTGGDLLGAVRPALDGVLSALPRRPYAAARS